MATLLQQSLHAVATYQKKVHRIAQFLGLLLLRPLWLLLLLSRSLSRSVLFLCSRVITYRISYQAQRMPIVLFDLRLLLPLLVLLLLRLSLLLLLPTFEHLTRPT